MTEPLECPNCGSRVSPDLGICPKCGTAVAPPVAMRLMQPPVRCIGCGAELWPRTPHCPQCGKSTQFGARQGRVGCAIAGLVGLLLVLAAGSSCALGDHSGSGFGSVGVVFIVLSLIGIVWALIVIFKGGN